MPGKAKKGEDDAPDDAGTDAGKKKKGKKGKDKGEEAAAEGDPPAREGTEEKPADKPAKGKGKKKKGDEEAGDDVGKGKGDDGKGKGKGKGDDLPPDVPADEPPDDGEDGELSQEGDGKAKRLVGGLTRRERAFFNIRTAGGAPKELEELDQILAKYKGMDLDPEAEEEARQWEELDKIGEKPNGRELLLAKFREELKKRKTAEGDIDVLDAQIENFETQIPEQIEQLRDAEQQLRERKLEVEHKGLLLDKEKLKMGEQLRGEVKRYHDHATALEEHVSALEADWDVYVADRQLSAEEVGLLRKRRVAELEKQKKRMGDLHEKHQATIDRTEADLRRQGRRIRRQGKAITRARQELGIPEPVTRRVGLAAHHEVLDDGTDSSSGTGSTYYTYGSGDTGHRDHRHSGSSYYYYDDLGVGADGPQEEQWISDAHLRVVFDRIDINRDGLLTRYEVIRALHSDDEVRTVLGIGELTSDTINNVFTGMDDDLSGDVTFPEFRREILSRARQIADAIAAAEDTSRAGSELRVDPADGLAKSRSQFVASYGNMDAWNSALHGGRREASYSRPPKPAQRYLGMVHQVVHRLNQVEALGDQHVAAGAAHGAPAERGTRSGAPMPAAHMRQDPEAGFDFPLTHGWKPPAAASPAPPGRLSGRKWELFGGVQHPAVPVERFSAPAPRFASPRREQGSSMTSSTAAPAPRAPPPPRGDPHLNALQSVAADVRR